MKQRKEKQYKYWKNRNLRKIHKPSILCFSNGARKRGGGGEKGKTPLFSCYRLYVSDVGSPSFS